MCRIIFFVIEVTYKFFIYLCFVVVVVVLIFSCKNCECLYKEGYSRSSIKKYPILQFLTALDTGFYKHWCILNLFIFTICKDSIIILPYRLFFLCMPKMMILFYNVIFHTFIVFCVYWLITLHIPPLIPFSKLCSV